MNIRAIFLAALFCGLNFTGALAEAEGEDLVDVELKARFAKDDTAETRSLDQERTDEPAPVDPRRGYGSITYKIGDKSDRDYLRKAILAFTETLPQKFGNSEGTYTITIIVKDSTGKDLVKEPILSFQWKNQRVFFVIDKVVDQLLATQWAGTLVDDVLVADTTRRYKVGIEVFQSSSRAMDFDSLKKTSKIFSEGALAAFLPLPAATAGVITAVGDIVDLFYSGSRKETLAEYDEYEIMNATQVYSAPIRFRDTQNRPWTLPVKLTIKSRPSRYMSGSFDASKVTVSMAGEKTFTIVTAGDNQIRASLLELIRGSEAHPEARALLDSIAAKKKYETGDVASDCGALYSAIANYFSVYDARALFWAFLKQNGSLVDAAACLDGGRREELEQVGLKP